MRKRTRRELALFLTEHGYPISVNTLNRLCQPSVAQGPPVAGRWGSRDLYDDATLLEWAEERAKRALAERRAGTASPTTTGKPTDDVATPRFCAESQCRPRSPLCCLNNRPWITNACAARRATTMNEAQIVRTIKALVAKGDHAATRPTSSIPRPDAP
jgi:hypothetical protein